MKLPDAPFIYLVLLARREATVPERCWQLDKAQLQVANAITALDPAERTFPTTPNTKYLWQIGVQAFVGRTTHNAYVVGANEEYPTDDILEFIRELPDEQRKDYLLDKDW